MPVLREIVAAGVVQYVTARATQDGFTLVANVNQEERILLAQRGGVRFFKTLDAVARCVMDLGLVRFDVELITKDSQCLSLEDIKRGKLES